MANLRRVLIANRGEIALRILRSCRKLGLETVLAVSEADRDTLPARRADRTICIGPAPATHSYLRAETLVQAALGTGADAIHPGYGFLSERAGLAQLCEQHGIVFIGPTAAQITAVGDKLRARAHAIGADVPVVPGGPVASPGEAVIVFLSGGPPEVGPCPVDRAGLCLDIGTRTEHMWRVFADANGHAALVGAALPAAALLGTTVTVQAAADRGVGGVKSNAVETTVVP